MTLCKEMLEHKEELYKIFKINLDKTLNDRYVSEPYYQAMCITLSHFTNECCYDSWGGDEYLLLQEIIFKKGIINEKTNI